MPRCGEDVCEARAKCRREARQDVATSGDQRERQPAGIEARRGHLAPQPPLQREQQLDAAGAGADHANARARPCARARAPRAPRSGARKPSIGLTGMACSLAPGTSPVFGVEPMLSESSRRAPAAGRGRSRVRPARSRPIDLVLVEPRAGEAARAGRCRCGPRRSRRGRRSGPAACRSRACAPRGVISVRRTPGHRLHAEHAQHRDMRVAGADQHHVLEDWSLRLHVGLIGRRTHHKATVRNPAKTSRRSGGKKLR